MGDGVTGNKYGASPLGGPSEGGCVGGDGGDEERESRENRGGGKKFLPPVADRTGLERMRHPSPVTARFHARHCRTF